ncbi:MAG: GH1 family beta-glucosidase [Novosphingobium sp.]
MTKFSRRQFAGAAGAGTALAAAWPSGLVARPSYRQFPDGFHWGCATAAYQIEGAVDEDGRGPSVWDVFSHSPGTIKDGTNGDIATDSYHRFREDARLLTELGANSYRLSFAWPRFFPQGRGQPNRKAVDHYKRVIDNLLEHRIEPYVTLYHWDLPIGLPGGWQSRDTAQAFADYAGYVTAQFSDRVRHFVTLNEISTFIDVGYGTKVHAPGLALGQGAALNQARHHALLAHGLGVQAIRAHGRVGTQVGLAENSGVTIPAIETEANIAAAKKAFRSLNAAHIVPILDGAYSDEHLAKQGANAPKIAAGDMAAIGSPLDFIGLNIYSGVYVEPADTPAGFAEVRGGANYPTMGLDWLRVAPEAAYWGPRLLAELWQPKAIYISENGTVAADKLENRRVGDAERIMFLRSYIGQLQRAVAEGYPVKGYFLWTLLDNFEWAEGFTARFGIHYTDLATQQRIPKLSAAWYKEVIRRNAVV